MDEYQAYSVKGINAGTQVKPVVLDGEYESILESNAKWISINDCHPPVRGFLAGTWRESLFINLFTTGERPTTQQVQQALALINQ